jgi:hypothetical protein
MHFAHDLTHCGSTQPIEVIRYLRQAHSADWLDDSMNRGSSSYLLLNTVVSAIIGLTVYAATSSMRWTFIALGVAWVIVYVVLEIRASDRGDS